MFLSKRLLGSNLLPRSADWARRFHLSLAKRLKAFRSHVSFFADHMCGGLFENDSTLD